MADYLLRNSLNPNKVVKCTITFRQIVNKGEEGEPVWLIEIGTVEPHKDGGSISPVFVHYHSSQNIDEAIKEATETIAAQVDWETLLDDKRPPFVSYNSPIDEDQSVDIYSNIVIDITDLVPTAGIDIDSIEMTVNGFDVTNELTVSGDPFEYRVIWKPFLRILDYYD